MPESVLKAVILPVYRSHLQLASVLGTLISREYPSKFIVGIGVECICLKVFDIFVKGKRRVSLVSGRVVNACGECDLGFFPGGHLCGDEDHAVGSFRTVDGCGGSILEHLYGCDVLRVETKQRVSSVSRIRITFSKHLGTVVGAQNHSVQHIERL